MMENFFYFNPMTKYNLKIIYILDIYSMQVAVIYRTPFFFFLHFKF